MSNGELFVVIVMAILVADGLRFLGQMLVLAIINRRAYDRSGED